MNWKTFCAVLFLMGGVSAETVLDLDFAADVRRVDSEKVGSFHGVLPRRLSDNFSSWSTGRVTGEVLAEGTNRFLRLVTAPGEEGGQFAIGGIAPKFPGVFRLRLRARTSNRQPVSCGLRLNGAPYTGYSSHSFAASEWTEKAYLFAVRQKATGSVGLYFHTGTGTADLQHVTLETATEDDLAAQIRRPPKTQAEYIRHARFPLGLPGGWNLGRDCVDAIATADAQEPAEDGVPVLKVSATHPWTLWGEAFQTAWPGTPHTLVFSYRSGTEAQVTVMDNAGHWVAHRKLPASAAWRTERLAFTPSRQVEAFGLCFSGERGPFRLDRVHVWHGSEEPVPAACSVSLAVAGGEIAGETRILFADEPAEVLVRTLGLPADATLAGTVTDLYGRTEPLAEVHEGGRVRFDRFPDAPLGQFRVSAWAERKGRRLSAVEELVVTRLPRPVAWNRDAPDSPFGCHVNPTRTTVKILKAGGVNWVRLHDAGTHVTGWYAQEPQRGAWRFHDDEVATYRAEHLKIFGQLGTAPTWATHYGDMGYKYVGYFERYLRPTNSVDWVNYVATVVSHYRRDIDQWFVWNEPWGSWWKSAADVKKGYFDAKTAERDYAALCRLAYDAVKRVDPGIRVSGFNSYSGKGGEAWSAGVLAGGGFDCCDMIDWHYYTPHPRAVRGEADISRLPLAPIRAQSPDLGGKPVYMSEGQGTSSGSAGKIGYMSGLLSASVPWAPETPDVYASLAEGTCRYVVSLLAEGNAKVFLYTAHSYDGLARTPNFLVLLGADGFAYPSLVAHAQLARALEGRRFVRKEAFGSMGMKYVFAGADGECAVYTDLTPDEMQTLAAKGPLVDLYGNLVSSQRTSPAAFYYGK